jgi:hypothetical protein
MTTSTATVEETKGLRGQLKRLGTFNIVPTVIAVDSAFDVQSEFSAQQALAMADGYYVGGMVAPLEKLLQDHPNERMFMMIHGSDLVYGARSEAGMLHSRL